MEKKREPTSPPPLKGHTATKLFMAGVRDPRQDVAPAVRHAGACEFRAFRRAPLTHRRVDSCRPLVYAFGIGVINDHAPCRRRSSVYVLFVEGVERGHALLELFLKRRHHKLLNHPALA